MFSGIVECQSRVFDAQIQHGNENGLIRIAVERPTGFGELRRGDSIAVNGVCLTVEDFDDKALRFALGAETLQVTGWTVESLRHTMVNLELSLRFGDRIHGHMVSGHVDAMGEVTRLRDIGGSFLFDVKIPSQLKPFLWKKGSWAVNGVSLTINEVQGDIVSMCLIPETFQRTNLGALRPGDTVTVEVDMMARGLVHAVEAKLSEKTPTA